MIIKDESKLRSLFALKGLHRQVDIAKEIFLSENSVVRLFKGERVNNSTAKRIASYLGVDVTEVFEEDPFPKGVALTLVMA